MVLIHFPKYLKSKLLAMGYWKEEKEEQYVVKLLELVRKIYCGHDETKKSTMELVESDI